MYFKIAIFIFLYIGNKFFSFDLYLSLQSLCRVVRIIIRGYSLSTTSFIFLRYMNGSSLSHRFAAALKNLKVWVMNVVSIDSADTLPIIYERGLFGIYHDWCESFNTYPRSYDLLHADHLFSKVKTR